MNAKKCIRFYSLLCALLTTIPILGEGFLAGTLICTPKGYVAIEELLSGDQVISCDFNNGYCQESIVDITSHETAEFVRLKIDNSIIDVDGNQKFFVPFVQEWIQASQLTEGTCVLGAPLHAEYVKAVEKIPETTYVYHLSLSNHHNYLVCQRNIIVHNYEELGRITFETSGVVAGTTVLNAFLLAHPLTAPIVICAGAATVIGCIARTFYSAFKESKNATQNDKNNSTYNNTYIEPTDSVRGFSDLPTISCGIGQLQDQPLSTGNCLPELDKKPKHSDCPEQKTTIENGTCVIDEPAREPRPCGFQGQTLPGFGSDTIPTTEIDNASEGESAGVEKGEREGEAVATGEDGLVSEENQEMACEEFVQEEVFTSVEAQKEDDVTIVNEFTTLNDTLVKVEGRGNSKGRTEPKDYEEKLAMNEVMSNPDGTKLEKLIMTDPRWPSEEGWSKYAQNVDDKNGHRIEIHYVYNEKLNQYDDFKFKDD